MEFVKTVQDRLSLQSNIFALLAVWLSSPLMLVEIGALLCVPLSV